MNRTLLAMLALGATVACASPAFAEKLKAVLDAKSEVPPNNSTATGTVDIEYDPATRKLSWKLTYTGLTGTPAAAHFHGPASPSQTGPVAVTIPKTSSGSEGNVELTEAQAADLLAGKYYVNIHTATYPGGEIRGQVTK